jgi:fatty acid desaturase
MNGGRFGALAHGLRHLRRAPDLAALRAARSPNELARLALIPAARNLGIAAGFLPADIRAEATAALLACRVLDAYEDLIDRPLASDAVLTAVDYLNGASDTPPPPPHAVAVRDSEAVDLVLAERIHDVRTLLCALPCTGRERVGQMLVDVGRVMARNLDSALPRAAYGEGVLGRVVLYACSLVAEEACTEADLSELAGCIGVTAQLANDLRDGEFALYGAADREELTKAVMLRLLAPALGGFALLDRLGPRTPSRGARVAMAYMTITTAAFLCAAVGAPAPYRRRLRLGTAVLAARSAGCWTTMLQRVRRSTDEAIHRLLDGSLDLSTDPGLTGMSGPAGEMLSLGDPRSMAPSMGPLIVGSTFALVCALPEEPLSGELPATEVRRMMIADHLAFGALERLHPRDTDAMAVLATQFQLAALDGTAPRSLPVISDSTVSSARAPVAPSEQAPFSRKVLKLEHPANVGPLAHIVCWVGLLAFGLLVPAATNWYLAVPLIATLMLLNLSITIGVLHMHTHRPLFVSRRMNRVLDVMCCVPATLTAADMREVHVLNHHRYNDGPGDVTSTQGREQGLRAVWYWIRYGMIVKIHTVRTVFAADASPSQRKHRHQFIIDLTLVFALLLAGWFVVDPTRYVLFYWIPFLVTQVNAGYFAWLTHAPARVFGDDPSKSMNTVGNWLNFFIFNQGYHGVHHRYPGIHWSQIPDKLDFMRQVQPAVIVPYWMTLNSAWRLVMPRGFHDATYGERWKAKLAKRMEQGTVRSRYLPWFAWI